MRLVLCRWQIFIQLGANVVNDELSGDADHFLSCMSPVVSISILVEVLVPAFNVRKCNISLVFLVAVTLLDV